MSGTNETKTWECTDCLETFQVESKYFFSYCPKCYGGNCALGSRLTDIFTSLGTLTAALRGGFWGQGSGEFEDGELMLAEEAIAKARIMCSTPSP